VKIKNVLGPGVSPGVVSNLAQLKDVPAFTPTLVAPAELLSSLPPAKTYPPGSLLVEQERPVTYISLIHTGVVKLTHVNSSGREVMAGLRSDGWYAGCTSVLLQTLPLYSVQAVTHCRIIKIPALHFVDSLNQNPKMMEHFFSVQCLEVASQAHMHLELLASSAQERLEHFMGERMSGDPETLDPLPVLKQAELAQLLAVTPEHLSRMMKRLRSSRVSLGQRAEQAHTNLVANTQSIRVSPTPCSKSERSNSEP
jgi:CRP-like cAMP-binding protein